MKLFLVFIKVSEQVTLQKMLVKIINKVCSVLRQGLKHSLGVIDRNMVLFMLFFQSYYLL